MPSNPDLICRRSEGHPCTSRSAGNKHRHEKKWEGAKKEGAIMRRMLSLQREGTRSRGPRSTHPSTLHEALVPV
eukprot:84730-Pyramimonas_sp.AAC.2